MHPLDNIIDVNLHRFREGARVLEDIARFVFEDMALFEQIKAIKHRAIVPQPDIARPEGSVDIGGPDFDEGATRADLMQCVYANAGRMQESARVLEELLDRTYFKALRYAAYEIGERMILLTKAYLQKEKLTGSVYICNLDEHTPTHWAKEVNASGTTLCQCYARSLSKRQLYEAVNAFRKVLNDDILLILHDHLDIALLTADGVHLSQDNIPVIAARELAGPSFVIGVTVENIEQARLAQQHSASYLCTADLKSNELDIPVCMIDDGGCTFRYKSIRFEV